MLTLYKVVTAGRAAPADHVAPTADVSGVITTAIGAIADLSTVRRGDSHEVRSAREN